MLKNRKAYDLSLVQEGSQFRFKFLKDCSRIDLIVSYSSRLIYSLKKDSNGIFNCDLKSILLRIDELGIRSNKVIFKLDGKYVSIRH